MLLKHTPLYRANAFYYPSGITDYMDLYTDEQLLAVGFPSQSYLYQEDDESVLKDLTRADSGESISANESSGSLDDLFG